MIRSLLKVLLGVVFMIASVFAGAVRPLFAKADSATLGDLLVQVIPSILFLLGLVMCVVGVIQFVFRTVRTTFAVGHRALAKQNGA